MSKEATRANTKDLIATFLRQGNVIKVCKPGKPKGLKYGYHVKG